MKKLFILFVMIGSIFAIPSCSSDFLDTKPTGSTSTADIFYTVDNALTAINGIHRSMYAQWEGTQNEGGLSCLLLSLDYTADDIVELSASNGWFRGIYQWTVQANDNSSEVRYPWHLGYNSIANANMIIANIENATGDANEKKEILAQALTYRAYFYLLMVQIYGKRYDWTAKPNTQLGVPLRLEPTIGEIARSTVEEVYVQIFKDLEQAITLFNEANITRSSKSHLNKYIAQGIKARAALTTGQWQVAVDAARIARTAPGVSLMDSVTAMSGNSSVSNPEWMWASYQQSDQPLYFYSYYAYISFNFNSSNIRGCPKCANSVMYAAISNTDVRKKWWEANPTSANMADLQGPLPSNYTLRPLMNRKFRVSNNGSSIADYMYMRIAEMYLIEAEALARLNDLSGAQTALTALAQKRDRYYTATATNTQDLLNEILMQRRIELWGEGFRFLDLKRMNLPLDRTGTNHLETYCTVMTVPVTDNRWQYLIPKKEMETNSALTQNDR